jgi:outer membrane protein TolC
VRLRLALPLAGGVLLAASAGAQSLSAADAVRETLARDPKVSLALAQVDERSGQYREFSGTFDGVAFVDTKLDVTRQGLAGEVLKEERKRRIQLELVDRFFSNAAESINAFLADGDVDETSLLFLDTAQRNLNKCSPTQTTVVIDLGTDIAGVEEGSVFLCLDSSEDFGTVRAIGLGLPGGGSISTESLRTLYFFSRLRGLTGPLEDFRRETTALLNDQGRIALRIVRQVAESARFARARLGGLPEEQELVDFSTQVGYRHRMRNGIGVTPTLELKATEENFAGKLRIVQFGDSTKANLFTATARVAVDFPLGRNRGKATVRASELAAESNLRAARALAVQTASDQALETLKAYWEVAAAQERVAVLEHSVRLKEEIDVAVGDLIEGEEMPGVERHRSSAQLAQARGQVASARQQLASARAELARAIGLEGSVSGVDGLVVEPLAAYVGAADLAPADVAALLERALARRADLVANGSFVEANRILERAARTNLRPDVTLALNFSYAGLEESFEDRYYDLEGFWKAASGKVAGPSYGVALRFTVPVGNHEARGRLIQAGANVESAQIQEADLKRTVELRVHEAVASLDRIRAELEARRATLDNQQLSVDANLERLKAGDLSVLDALNTEDKLTEAKLGWIEAMRAYLELESRLRFETNTLLVDGGFEADPRSLALRPLDQPAL